MSGICDTCKRKDCYMEHDGDDSCPLYLKGKQSNYKRLFGTPDRAARTLRRFCADCFCGDCATCGVPEWADYTRDYDALLEWLHGEGESE